MNDVLEDTPEEEFAQLTQTVERLILKENGQPESQGQQHLWEDEAVLRQSGTEDPQGL